MQSIDTFILKIDNKIDLSNNFDSIIIKLLAFIDNILLIIHKLNIIDQSLSALKKIIENICCVYKYKNDCVIDKYYFDIVKCKIIDCSNKEIQFNNNYIIHLLDSIRVYSNNKHPNDCYISQSNVVDASNKIKSKCNVDQANIRNTEEILKDKSIKNVYVTEICEQSDKLKEMKKNLNKKIDKLKEKKRIYESDISVFEKINVDIENNKITDVPELFKRKYFILDFIKRNLISFNEDMTYYLYEFLYNCAFESENNDECDVDEDIILSKYKIVVDKFITDEIDNAPSIDVNINNNKTTFDDIIL